MNEKCELAEAGNVNTKAGIINNELIKQAEELTFADRWEAALEAINRALELDSRNGLSWNLKAFILTNLDRQEDALSAFDEAILQNPGNISSWQCKASLLAEMKRYDEAIYAYDKAIELIPENNTEELALTWAAKGMALKMTCNQADVRKAFQKALELYDKASEENLDDVSLQQSKGHALFNLGRYDEAIKIYDQILETTSSIEPYLTQTTTLIGKGDALQALGRNQEALSAYNKAIELSPLNAPAWLSRGIVLKALCRNAEADAANERARELGNEG